MVLIKVNHLQKTKHSCYEKRMAFSFSKQTIFDKITQSGKYWGSSLKATQLNRGGPAYPAPVAARQTEPVGLFSALFPPNSTFVMKMGGQGILFGGRH